MAKSLLKIQARGMRSLGKSVSQIAIELGVSKSTTSLWVRDIILSVEQMESLKQSSLIGAELGRLKSALLQKERRLRLIDDSKRFGKEALSTLTEREFLVAGLALYWGEGYKKGREFSFCNSDPEMVKFLIRWLHNCFQIAIEDIKCSVGINEIHKEREELVRKYWSETLGIPLSQFTKTSFKKVTNKKIYLNFNEHFGTIRIRIKNSGAICYKVLGLIEGLKINMPG